MMSFFAAVGFGILLLIVASKSHRAMNLLSVIHPAAYLILAAYSLSYALLPQYFFGGGYFFMDHLGLFEVSVSSFLFLLAAVYSKGYLEGSMRIGEMSQETIKLYYAAFNLLLITITFSFFSNNLALFWILAELTTAFSAVLIVTLNAKKNIGAALKYIFLASTAMLFSFIGLIFLFAASEHAIGTGTLNWSALMGYAGQLSPTILLASFAFIFIGFAAKSGVAPFHAWLPTAHSKAPAPISVVLSGSVTAVGIYGILRIYAILHQTTAMPMASSILLIFGLFTMFVAVFCMLCQVNLKKLIGYSTIEHMGILLIGIGIGTPAAIFWTVFHKLAHSLTKALLFFSAGIIHHQYESVRLEHIKNAIKLQPFASAGIIIGGAAIIGMPLFSVFLSKLSILIEAANKSSALLIGMLVLLLIASAAFGLFLSRMLAHSEPGGKMPGQYNAPLNMKLPIIALIAIIILMGIYFPQYLKDLLQSIVAELGIK